MGNCREIAGGKCRKNDKADYSLIKFKDIDFQVNDVMMIPFFVVATTKVGDGVMFEIILEQVTAHAQT